MIDLMIVGNAGGTNVGASLDRAASSLGFTSTLCDARSASAAPRLVSMLNWMRASILRPVQGLTVAQLDHLHDDKANSIGALLLHLAAIERLYQINTFEGRKWGDVRNETEKEWGAAARLGDEARKSIKGHQLAYYLGKLKEVRKHTLAELQKRDDAWLMQIDSSAGEPTNNYCKWFHVCEHESHHNGQVTWLKGRLPA